VSTIRLINILPSGATPTSLGAALHPPPRAHGMAGFVLANGSMSSNQSGEGDIRRALIEADLVDCMVALPGQLFY
jgi:type I restriction-modification system DNA methylase subunit